MFAGPVSKANTPAGFRPAGLTVTVPMPPRVRTPRAAPAWRKRAQWEARADVHAGPLRDHVRIAELHGDRRLRLRRVPDGLSVRTDRAHARDGYPRRFRRRDRSRREPHPDLHVERGDLRRSDRRA